MNPKPPKAPDPGRSARIYRWLLRLFFASDVVRRNGAEMESVFFRILERERRAHGWRGVASTWMHAISDGFMNGWIRRVGSRGPTRLARRSGFISLLDLKLALRRMWKHWGLTLVGGVAMTTAIAIGVVVFGILDAAAPRSLPLDEGRRVVALQTWDPAARVRLPTDVASFRRWEEQLTRVEDIGAFQTVERNVMASDVPPEPVRIAEMTASGFELARVPPLLGRTLQEADERAGAPPVIVIGYGVWQTRFGGDGDIVGRSILLDGAVHTVVGVMPEGFRFPVFHDYWTPLRTEPTGSIATTDGNGGVFARLADGTSVESADAELSAVGLVPGAEGGGADAARAGVRVIPYTTAFLGEGGELTVLRILSLLVGLLLIPPCANLAILIYARTVTRQGEFAARHALGASRGRIVLQLFIEVLALAGFAGVAALVFVRFALVRFGEFIKGQPGADLPFWFDVNPGLRTILFASVLVLAAAVVAGLVPALRATDRMLQSGLRTAGGGSAPALGRRWTVLIVAQVGLSMAVIPTAVEMTWGTVRGQVLGPGFPTENFLSAVLEIDPDAAAGPDQAVGGSSSEFSERWGTLQAELMRRLVAEPGVSAAALGSGVVGDGSWVSIEVEPVDSRDPSLPAPGMSSAHLVQVLRVDDRFLETYEIPVIEGRGFDARDLEGDASPVIVNETFRRQVLRGRSPVGLRFRYPRAYSGDSGGGADPAPWHEVVGVIADIPDDGVVARTYHPAAPADLLPSTLSIRLSSDGSGVPIRLREIAASLDPSLRVNAVRTLDDISRQRAFGNSAGALALVAGTLSVLLLATGGIYALMFFVVNQRRREVGIRSALGAPPTRLLMGIFRRALWQLGAGAAVGALAALVVQWYVPTELLEAMGGWQVPGVLPATMALMLLAGLLAALGPARRGLAIEPTEAMETEG